ncbi:hypothetical protein PF002_g27324 [Phytophthora fragariae]|uniref:Uncharacterized protein n=1 Tax=Phytophthora fragariae TaxID=53985 RepID=A0A6A3RWW4_9STRA|nr:hypothetical protein PF009_g27311 [Phytophthora fragariae]KAE9104670.1 hypothetical protein PF006_g21847 [Phytophthora fragariae]KAE9178046.1 hypothetical protein PF004_g25605 [Phytophthora fragariae]KAE9181261.1 hypothetical protein PF002_g27324 [Phytophthora fragariae]
MPRAPNILVGVQITAIRTASAAFGVSRRRCFCRSSSLLVLIRSSCLPRCSSTQNGLVRSPAPWPPAPGRALG